MLTCQDGKYLHRDAGRAKTFAEGFMDFARIPCLRRDVSIGTVLPMLLLQFSVRCLPCFCLFYSKGVVNVIPLHCICKIDIEMRSKSTHSAVISP